MMLLMTGCVVAAGIIIWDHRLRKKRDREERAGIREMDRKMRAKKKSASEGSRGGSI